MTDTVVAPDVPVGAPHVVAWRRLLAQRTRNGDLLLVDCSRVERLPPAVLALLVAASRVARCSGGRLLLVHASPPAVEALRRSGLTHLLR
jgi:anti-anti-sigma regulatory factor